MPAGRILIVDPGHTHGQSSTTLLEDEGYDVELACDGREAVVQATTCSPDLILVDAGANGPELCEHLRSVPHLARIPVLMAVALERRDLCAAGVEAGVDDVIFKPLDPTELSVRARSLTRLRRARAEQQRLQAELGKRNHQLLSLQSAGVAITSSLDLQQVLGSVIQQIAGLLQMRACTILGFDRGARTLFLMAEHSPDGWRKGTWPSTTPRLADLPGMEAVLLERRATYVSLDQDGISADERAHMERAGITMVLRLPMVFQDAVLGLVEVTDDREGRTLAAEEISLAQLLANQAAGAIENARLYDAIRRHIAEVTTLNKISQVITSILDLRETLAIIADHALWLLDVAAASVILCDEERGDLWFGAASGEGSEFIRGKRLSKGKGIVNWVIQQGEPLIVPDTSQDPRFFDEWDKAMDFTTRSILCVPLKTKRKTIGAIEAINKASGPFDGEDLNLLRSMAASAAIAIENARLYEQAQQELAERKRIEAKVRKVNRVLRTLGECHETLMHAEDEAALLQDVCRSLVETGGQRLAWVGYTDQDDDTVRVMALAGDDGQCPPSAPIPWADTDGRSHPVATAIRTRKPCLVTDVCDDAGWASCDATGLEMPSASLVALPLLAHDLALGALTVHAGQPDAFDAEEVELLQELANNLGLGIVALRTRVERDQAEAEIHRLYQELQDRASSLEETVTKRTRELQLARDRTRAILEAVGEAVIVTDLTGKIQYMNPAAVALTGYALEEVAGTSPGLWQADESVADSLYDGDLEEGPGVRRTRRVEVVSRRRDGTLYDAAMTVAPLFDSQQPDRPVGLVCVQRDITPVREAERLKDQFISNVSHELRTPLSVIALVSGNLDRLYERLDDEKRRQMVRDIRQHAQVLNDLVGGVLELSRIESGRISMERQRIDLVQLVREESEKQQPLAEGKSQTLRVIGAEHLATAGNGDQIRQVVRNLLNNAIKYTPRDGEITCECAALTSGASEAVWPGCGALGSGAWAALRVVDTGIGIGPKDLPQVFERFYRVETQGSVPGTGLGLSIAKELVDAHGGHVAAASTPGEGSTFAIYLPLLEE